MKSKIVIAVFILTLTIIGGGLCFGGEFYEAKARDISDREYEKAIIELIDNAKESVVIGMYYISTEVETNNPVKMLLNDLVEAEKRGVAVRIYLNTKFPDVSYEELISDDEFKRLKDAGCEVYFIPQGRRLHDKDIIVDRRFVVEGSMNWSIIALRNNFESATLIDSPGLAEEKIARLEKIYRTQKEKEDDGKRERNPLYLDSITERIEIKKALLEDERYFSRMLKRSDNRVMDLYLILAAYSQKLGKDEFFLNLEDAGLGLGLPASWDDEALRRQVIRALRTLQDRYKLIKVEFYHATDTHVVILPISGESFTIETGILVSGRTQESSAFPRTLRPRSHNKEIPQRLKFLLMIKALLEKEGTTLTPALSHKWEREIMRRFHIAERTLEKALADLKK